MNVEEQVSNGLFAKTCRHPSLGNVSSSNIPTFFKRRKQQPDPFDRLITLCIWLRPRLFLHQGVKNNEKNKFNESPEMMWEFDPV